jgi:rSAM/selenodomain-associated transferase 2
MDVSVVIPALNEEKSLPKLLEELSRQSARQIIVADGGSRDQTVNIARGFGADVVSLSPCRGRQLNTGAAIAVGEALFFVHADATIPPNAVSLVSESLSGGRCVGGSFSIAIDSRRPSFRFIFWMINQRSRRLRLPYGDQGIFTSREAFDTIGGYRDIPIMEDLDFMRRMNRLGPTLLLPQKIVASARRYDKEGPVFSTFRNWLLVTLFAAGVDPERMLKLYPHVR